MTSTMTHDDLATADALLERMGDYLSRLPVSHANERALVSASQMRDAIAEAAGADLSDPESAPALSVQGEGAGPSSANVDGVVP